MKRSSKCMVLSISFALISLPLVGHEHSWGALMVCASVYAVGGLVIKTIEELLTGGEL